MTGRAVVEAARGQELRLETDGKELRVRGPLTPALGTMLKYYKDEVIEELQDEESRAGAARRHRQPRFVMSFLPGPPEPGPPPVLSSARFADGVHCELRRAGTRWSMWIALAGRRYYQRPFASPHLGHARRCAEEWYGPTVDGWTDACAAEPVHRSTSRARSLKGGGDGFEALGGPAGLGAPAGTENVSGAAKGRCR